MEPKKILQLLKKHYKDGGVTLEAKDSFQLLIATILSAQCTDERVNKVTKLLFKKFPTPASLANAPYDEVVEIIKPVGFFKQKAKYIIETARLIVEQYGSKVPSKRKDLEALPGVGRKTANIVLSKAYSIPAIAVDTHVKRVASRIFGLNGKTPLVIEKFLMENLPEELWNDVNLTLIFHGRATCRAKRPLCNECIVNKYCNFFKEKGRSYGSCCN